MNYLTINNEMFPYENAQYSDTDIRITGQHLVHCFTPDVPERIKAKFAAVYKTETVVHPAEFDCDFSKRDDSCPCHREMDLAVCQFCPNYIMVKPVRTETKQVLVRPALIDIRDLAEIKVLEQYPEYNELTSYRTRKRGYYKLLNEQIRKTMYWAVNKQPASITFIANKIDGVTKSMDAITEPGSLYSKIQTCIQIGVTVQVVIPETGYSCMIPAVTNKKLMPIFTKRFICEKYLEQYESGELQDVTMIADIEAVKAKVTRLREYRKDVQDAIWTQVNYALEPHKDEWKCQNVYTLPTRMAFAVNKQAEDILFKYNEDFKDKIPVASQLTVETLYKKPELFEQMIEIISIYGPAFGVNVKLSEGEPDTMTFVPIHWMRKKTAADVITEAMALKQHQKALKAFQQAPLDELLRAYIQIDWYLSQTNPEEFYVRAC
jgi:hypothetical protein